MTTTKPTKRAVRDKFSGHWWIIIGNGLAVEAYRAGKYDWDLCGVYGDDRCWFTYKQLDPKRNIVYPYYRNQAVPSFCSLRAIVNWVESIQADGVNNKPTTKGKQDP